MRNATKDAHHGKQIIKLNMGRYAREIGSRWTVNIGGETGRYTKMARGFEWSVQKTARTGII